MEDIQPNDRDSIMYRNSILQRLNKVGEAPTMLTISLEIDRLVRDPNTSAAQIGRVIRLDPALTGKVLKIANSAIYATRHRIVSLQQAIARLGFSEIRRITMSIAVINSFKNYFVDYDKFWVHSITTAYLATALNRKTSRKANEDELYINGLLHDIGVLVLDQYFTTIYKKVFEIAVKRRFDLPLVENKILGINHAEVGSFLLNRWKLPENVVNVVLNHHQPQNLDPEYDTLGKIIYLANFICNNRGIDNGSGFFPEGFYDDIWDELGLSVEEVPLIIDSVLLETEKAKEILRLGGR